MWGGVVGDVYRGKAHFTLADLAVTSVRDEAVRYGGVYVSTLESKTDI